MRMYTSKVNVCMHNSNNSGHGHGMQLMLTAYID